MDHNDDYYINIAMKRINLLIGAPPSNWPAKTRSESLDIILDDMMNNREGHLPMFRPPSDSMYGSQLPKNIK